MTNEYLVVIHPAAEGTFPELSRMEGLTQLEGATIGLVDNARHNSDRFMANLETLLAEAGAARVTVWRKANPSIPIPAQVLDELAASCDAIVHGVAD